MYPLLFEIPIRPFGVLVATAVVLVGTFVFNRFAARRGDGPEDRGVGWTPIWVLLGAIGLRLVYLIFFGASGSTERLLEDPSSILTFDIPLRSFGVMVVAGFLSGTILFSRLVARHTDNPEQQAQGFASIPIWVLVGVLVGARLMYVVVEILRDSTVGQRFVEKPFTIFAYWEGGLVMYGGAAGGALAGLWCCARHKIALWNALDLGMTCAFLGLALGRIGCLLVGDDYGQVVPESLQHLPFPITLRVPDPLPGPPDASLFGEANAGKVLYATQVWMSLNAFALFLFGRLALRLRRYPGQATLWMLLWYSIARGTIEHFRGDEVRGVWFDGAISTSQVLSIVLGVACLALLFKNRGRRVPVPGRGQPAAA